LNSAHKRGLLHRDVKPVSIMLTDLDDDGEQRILLIDLGSARDVNYDGGFAATEMNLGTWPTAHQNNLLGEDVDGRADQYALATTAYHLLTGRPMSRTRTSAVVSHHLDDAPPPWLRRDRNWPTSIRRWPLAWRNCPRDRYAPGARTSRALSDQIAAGSSSYAESNGEAGAQWPPAHLLPSQQENVADRFTEFLTVDPRAVALRSRQFRSGPCWPAWPLVMAGLAVWLLRPSSDAPDSSGANASAPSTQGSELTDGREDASRRPAARRTH
jgi:serine/threonine protein kinase